MGLFSSLAHMNTRQKVIDSGPPEVAASSPNDPLGAYGFVEWASAEASTKLFLPYLDRLIATADAEEGEMIASHVGMAFARGKREALRALRADFLKWQDKPSS